MSESISVMDEPKILIIDLGSQYTLVIGRMVRELGYRTIIVSPKRAEKLLKTWKPEAIILSGGSASVYEDNAPQPPKKILKLGVPILGICYGMQWIAKELGGTVHNIREDKEYGHAKADLFNSALWDGIEFRKDIGVWASHGDTVSIIPEGFQKIATTNGGRIIAGMADPYSKKIWCLQFHPEVTHTDYGKTMLRNFLAYLCGCHLNWMPSDVIKEIRSEIISQVSPGDKAIIGFSGGVDSTTLAKIAQPIFGDNLLAICINTGALRKNEIAEIRVNAKVVGVKLKVVNAAKEFKRALRKATNPEVKRRIFKTLYQKILNREIKSFGANYIFQGTLATDLIESSKAGESALIKSHHNTGLKFSVKELRPFRNLFKYEVRDVARQLDLPKSISERQPFPGPALFVRVVGKPVTKSRLEIVRWADDVVTRILKKHNIYDDISQLVVSLDCNRTVGIKGDGRSYGYAIVVRGVITADFMTVRGFQIPDYIRREITTAVTKHRMVVRVYYDETNKPPATTEAE